VDEHGSDHVLWNRGMEDSRPSVCVCALYFGYVCIYVVSSPYLLVFGDDRVIRYMGVDDVTGGAGEV